MDIEEMNRALNHRNVPFNHATAVTGEGVLDTFKLVTRELMQSLRTKHDANEHHQGSGDKTGSRQEKESGTAAQSGEGNSPVSAPDRAVRFEGSESLEAAVMDVQKQICRIESQLDLLLEREDGVQQLLTEIRDKFDSVGEREAPELIAPEEPIILEEEEPKKRGFFWNR
jgi:hypothetical protein